MKNFFIFLITASFVIMTVGCSKDLKESSDRTTFKFSGKTTFSNPEKVTIKQLQFNAGRYVSKQVSFNGKVLEVSKGHTYFIGEDLGAKILIKTTGISGLFKKINQNNNLKVSVLGSVVYGARGLPIVDAQAVFLR